MQDYLRRRHEDPLAPVQTFSLTPGQARQLGALVDRFFPGEPDEVRCYDGDEVLVAVRAIVAESGASGPGDMGKVMGLAKAQLAGKAEMSAVSAAVKTALAG